ncbi:hypothetical protein DUI70_4781 [Streptomyces albus]|nr:hypothetical protein DUI70_4781 [Streptomyces albus]
MLAGSSSGASAITWAQVATMSGATKKPVRGAARAVRGIRGRRRNRGAPTPGFPDGAAARLGLLPLQRDLEGGLRAGFSDGGDQGPGLQRHVAAEFPRHLAGLAVAGMPSVKSQGYVA